MFDDMLLEMLRLTVEAGSLSVDPLREGIETYGGGAAYNAVRAIHNVAIRPVSAVVIALMCTIELARNASRIEGDRELGVKIIAASIFKMVLLVLVAQHALDLLGAIAEVASEITKNISVSAPSVNANTEVLNSAFSEQIQSANDMEQVGVLVLLLVPFIVSIICHPILEILIFFRFAELYLMMAFASLPMAFVAHPDTKNITVGYLRRFGAASLQGVVLIIIAVIYPLLIQYIPALNIGPLGDGEGISVWVVKNYISLLLGPAVFLVFVLHSGKLARALVGG